MTLAISRRCVVRISGISRSDPRPVRADRFGPVLSVFLVGLAAARFAVHTLCGLDVPDLKWLPGPLREATIRHQSVDFENWGFSLQRLTGNGPTFEIFDPSKPGPERWQLWMVDGRPPDRQTLEEYLKEEKPDGASLLRPLGVHLHESKTLERRNHKKELNPGVHDRDIIGELLFRVDEENEEFIDYHVDLSNVELEFSSNRTGSDSSRGLTELMKSLSCVVRVNRDPAYIRFFELNNEESFRPMAGVRINSVYVRTDYQAVEPGNTPMIHRLQFRLSGRALAVIPFTIVRETTFDDFRYTPPDSQGPEVDLQLDIVPMRADATKDAATHGTGRINADAEAGINTPEADAPDGPSR